MEFESYTTFFYFSHLLHTRMNTHTICMGGRERGREGGERERGEGGGKGEGEKGVNESYTEKTATV